MTKADGRGWKLHEKEQRMAWLRLTPAQRLAWLEEAKRFAEAAKGARRLKRKTTGAGPSGPSAR